MKSKDSKIQQLKEYGLTQKNKKINKNSEPILKKDRISNLLNKRTEANGKPSTVNLNREKKKYSHSPVNNRNLNSMKCSVEVTEFTRNRTFLVFFSLLKLVD